MKNTAEMEFIIEEAMRAVDYVDQSYFKYLVDLTKNDHWMIEEICYKCWDDDRQFKTFVDAVGIDYKFPGGENLLTYLVHMNCSTWKYLVLDKLGVDKHHKNDRGQNALDIALKLNHQTKIHALVDLGLVRTRPIKNLNEKMRMMLAR